MAGRPTIVAVDDEVMLSVMATVMGSGTFLVQPNLGLLAFGALCILGGVVTAVKGRYGWFVLGLVFGGVIWPFSAMLPAAPASPWRRLRGRRRPPTGRGSANTA